MMILSQNYNCFFPVSRQTEMAAAPAGFTPHISGPYIHNLNVIKLFNYASDLDLVGLAVNFKRVCISCIRKMYPLLSYQRPNYNVVIIHTKYPIKLSIPD